MKFTIGKPPEWAGKPKASPLDEDVDFQKLVKMIKAGELKPGEEAGLYINEVADGRRLKAKNPARMVRDTINRLLAELDATEDYNVTTRRTSKEGDWGVWITRLAIEVVRSRRRA